MATLPIFLSPHRKFALKWFIANNEPEIRNIKSEIRKKSEKAMTKIQNSF